ncbi:MAG: PfkB family carbohydrate kinase [Chitinophagales bacterium]|nr:hypothetical protein [Bacteroidota bacterium]
MDISTFNNKRVLVLGDIILDEFIQSTSTRNSPEYKAVPILSIQEKKQYLGGAANVALNLKKLHAIPYLIGTVGNDNAGDIIYKLLAEEDISNQYIHTNHRQKTTVKSRIFQDSNPLFRIDDDAKLEYEELINHFIIKNLTDAINNHKPHALILQDYNKGVLNEKNISEILAIAKQHHLLIAVDPKFDSWELYQNIDLFKPNEQEFLFMLNLPKISRTKQEWHDATKILQEKIQFKNLLLTLGEQGNLISNNETFLFSQQTHTLQHADVCGAGDTVIAVATLALLCGFSLEQIAELSNKAGYLVCQKENIQPISFEDLNNLII